MCLSYDTLVTSKGNQNLRTSKEQWFNVKQLTHDTIHVWEDFTESDCKKEAMVVLEYTEISVHN